MPAPRSSALLFCLISSAVLVAQDQGTRPSFKTTIGLVQIDVSVLDGKRQPIRGLQASDFTVLEDGTPRPIRVFEAIDLPSRPAPADVPLAADKGDAGSLAGNGVATNQIGDQSGRLVFILMDRTIPTGQPVLSARRIATAAIDALGPNDLAAVVTTGGLTPQTLTSDRARLRRAVNQGDWSTIISPEQQEIPTVGKYDPFTDGRCLCGLCVLETVTNLAMAAREAPLRNKLLLFIGSSIIVQSEARPGTFDVLGCDKRLEDARRTMFDALARSHLTVHSIDPTGLVTPMCQGSCNGKEGQDGQAMRRQKLQDETVQRLREQGSLGILPERTGGRTVMNTNAPQEKLPGIFHESDTYYVLAYEPSDPTEKESRRSIEVKVARSGAHVSTTRYAPPASGSEVPSRRKGTPVAPIDLALGGLLPDARVPLTMALAAFAGPDGSKAHVDVSLNADGFNAAGGGGAPLDVALAVLDQRGRRVSFAHGTGATTLPGDLHTQVLLPPGDYELRVAVQARGTDRAASVFAPLAVPSFADAPLSMSDIVMGTRERLASAGDTPLPLIPIVTSSARAFRRTDAVWAFVEVYQGTQRSEALASIPIRTTIEDADGRTVRGESATLDAATFVGRRAGVPLRLALAWLAPGRYLLRVNATRDSRTIGRSVAFVIE